jgi:hypothetical protein
MSLVKDELKEVEADLKKEDEKPVEARNGIIDIVAGKFISRKLLVWITGTVLLGFGKITPDEWTAITLGYVSIEGFADLAVKWKRG